MAHGATLPRDELPRDVELVRVDGRAASEPLAFDHADMVSRAVDDLRVRYGRRIDPSGLLPGTFTVLELRRLYETVFDCSLPKDSFRRLVIDAVEPTGRMSTSGAGRPAELFRRRGDAELPAGAAGLLTD
jgi:8-oxo-dGTP diphosphatase